MFTSYRAGGLSEHLARRDPKTGLNGNPCERRSMSEQERTTRTNVQVGSGWPQQSVSPKVMARKEAFMDDMTVEWSSLRGKRLQRG